MSQVTVVPSDKLIIVNGVDLRFDFSAPSNLHALQWFGDTGHQEWTDKSNTVLNEQNYTTEVAPYVALWQSEKTRLDKLAEAAAAEYNSLPKVRERKLLELDESWQVAESTGVIQSSLGFPVDANQRANRDVSGLISQFEMSSVTTTQFCDANNDFHEVTLDNLKVLQLELIQYAQSLYATKWQLRAAIEAAKTADELNAIDIKFVTDFTPTPVVLTPDTPTGSVVIDEKTSGPAIARALEWVGGTPDALTAGALEGLAKSGYSTSEDATMMLGSGYTAWCHEFTGTGDVIQTMPNITNERDGFLLFIRNSKTTGNVTLNPGGLGDTLDGKSSYVVAPGHSVLCFLVMLRAGGWSSTKLVNTKA